MAFRLTLRLAIVLFCSIAGSACTSTYNDLHPSNSDAASRKLFLYRVEIDQEAVRNGAQLIYREPSPHEEVGLRRRAMGYFGLADSGTCVVEVAVGEPVVSRGEVFEDRRLVLKFSGRLAADEQGATVLGGDRVPKFVQSNRVSEVRFIDRGDERIVLQAVRDGKPGAYIFFFRRSALPEKRVPFPFE